MPAAEGFVRELVRDWKQRIAGCNPSLRSGRLESVVGETHLAGLPGARLGERVRIGRRVEAEVIGFRGERAVLLPTGGRVAVAAGETVWAVGLPFLVPTGAALLGRVLDPAGRPLDGRGRPAGCRLRSLDSLAPAPLSRRPIDVPLSTGVRAIDAFSTLGRGQRIGLFAGPGVGKSTLLGQIARGTAADCCIVCLVGERGRELGEFVRRALGPAGLARSVVICATSDAPAADRARALPYAVTAAEEFRARGRHVLLLGDSLTRHARALREIALGAGEPPGRRGFPPSVFDRLAALVERCGTDARGSITAIFTVLTEGDESDDPLAEEARSLLDGHVVLSAELARAGCFPALDPVRALSRLMDRVADAPHRQAAAYLRGLWALAEDRRDLVAAGAVETGLDPELDRALAAGPRTLAWLRQDSDEIIPLAQTRESLLALAREVGWNG